MNDPLSRTEYTRLLRLRTSLRRLERWSEEQATAAGLTPAQHHLLLALRAHEDGAGPTIGELARHLLVRHNSAVGLVDRAETAQLVRRRPDRHDQRVVRVTLTDEGRRRLSALARLHGEELQRLSGLASALDEAERVSSRA